jgi:cytochrome c
MIRKTFQIFCLLALSFSAKSEFIYTYGPTRTQLEDQYALDLKNVQFLEKFTNALNKFLSIDERIEISAKSCGTRSRSITLCHELMPFNHAKLKKIFKSQLQDEQLHAIYLSELKFVLLHEVGHGMIDIYKLPVLGKEEDAADKFAAFMLLNFGGANVLKQATMFFHDTAIGKLDKFIDDKWAQLNGKSSVYGDEHSLDQQRLANLVCWGYGTNSLDFQGMVDLFKLPARRAMMCKAETEKMFRDIQGLLSSKLLPSTPREQNINFPISTPQTAEQVTVDKNEALNIARRNNCLACHGLDQKVIGPSIRDLSIRYRGASAVDQLMQRVRRGSSGQWGAVPMPPNSMINDNELRTLITWIVQNNQ